MIALRFIFLGYGMGALAGIALGAAGFSHLVGWLTAWIGGGLISVLLAYRWYLSVTGEHVFVEGDLAAAVDPAELRRWEADLAEELKLSTQSPPAPAEEVWSEEDRAQGRG